MGHRSLRPSRVHQSLTRMVETNQLAGKNALPLRIPPWYEALGKIPPGEILIRTQPAPTREVAKQHKSKKPSKLFKPEPIIYQMEDSLRQAFFRDHPWELARPRVILEQDGKDGQRCDWSKIDQPGRQLNGESVVQRALWLWEHAPHNLSISKKRQLAYDQARKEFYAHRYEEDVERRVAQEEALSTGAYFGKSRIEIGIELEDKAYETWKDWSMKQIAAQQLKQDAAYSDNEPSEDIDPSVESSTNAGEEGTVAV